MKREPIQLTENDEKKKKEQTEVVCNAIKAMKGKTPLSKLIVAVISKNEPIAWDVVLKGCFARLQELELEPRFFIKDFANILRNVPATPREEFLKLLKEKPEDFKLGTKQIDTKQVESLQRTLGYFLFAKTIDGLLAKGKKLRLGDSDLDSNNEQEFILTDSNGSIFQIFPGKSDNSKEALEAALNCLEEGLSYDDLDPLQLMLTMNKLVTSKFGQDVFTNNPELLVKYREIRAKTIQRATDRLHACATNLFNKITKEELENPNGYSDPKQCPNVVAMDTFIRGLALLIQKLILGQGHDGHGIDLRTLVLHDVLAVLEKLINKYGSLNAFMGIYAALTSQPIHSLEKTREGGSKSDKEMLTKLDTMMDHKDSNAKKNEKQDVKKKKLRYANMRNEESRRRLGGLPLQPLLLLVKTDVTYAKDGNIKTLPPDKVEDVLPKVKAYRKDLDTYQEKREDYQEKVENYLEKLKAYSIIHQKELEAYKTALPPLITPFLDAQRGNLPDYDRYEFHLLPGEYNDTVPLEKLSKHLESCKEDEVSAILSTLKLSGNIVDTDILSTLKSSGNKVVKMIYDKMPHSPRPGSETPRGRSGSGAPKPNNSPPKENASDKLLSLQPSKPKSDDIERSLSPEITTEEPLPLSKINEMSEGPGFFQKKIRPVIPVLPLNDLQNDVLNHTDGGYKNN